MPKCYNQKMLTAEQIEKKLNRILLRVQKPGRYVGGELNSIVKDWDKAKTKVAFVFPDIYDIGVSNVGLKVLYDQLKALGIPCEISFSAGAFVCNRLYFEFFQVVQNTPGFFVHFPFLPEQLPRNPGKEALGWDSQVKAFAEILNFFKNP